MTIVQGCRNSNIDLPRPSSICLNKNSYIYTGVLLYIYQGLASYSSESNFISTRVSFYIFEGLSFNLQATLSYIYNWISFWFIINTKPALFTFQHFDCNYRYHLLETTICCVYQVLYDVQRINHFHSYYY